ncbi:hypothetical protein K474DRAFT_1659768 [Panus rudis PR-1116 ss-1]|nr:hypothetical protein K474DRAFT_1659768 [Panus rudis PR-1116 ss-1]
MPASAAERAKALRRPPRPSSSQPPPSPPPSPTSTAMVPQPPPSSSPVAALQTAHNLAILTEYNHTLGSLPSDLSRNYADLRELDAVLSSSMSALTAKVTSLTEMIENNTCSKEERLWLLAEIADEAQKLKPGADDKIRVACLAADGVKSHKSHMSTLLDHMPDKEFAKLAGQLTRKTEYPHSAHRVFFSSGGNENGRRARRGGFGSLIANSAVDATPNKRKRAQAKDDDGDVVTKSPRKERIVDMQRPRANNRARKPDRAISPAESTLSVASHIPQASSSHHNLPSSSRQSASGRAPSASLSARRGRGQVYASDVNGHPEANGYRNDAYNAPPSSSTSHPSLPLPFTNGHHNREQNGTRATSSGVSEWAHGQLEGPGVPVARPLVPPVASADVSDAAPAGQDGDADGEDGKTYCFCNGISVGVMVGCDDPTCEREWFHLACVGLTSEPDGDWYCDVCRAKRQPKRTARGGKKRAGGGRSAGRNASG